MLSETIAINAEALNLTDEEFYNFCSQNKELKIEMDSNKQIYIMSPTGFLTGNRNAEIISLLRNWNIKDKSGYITDSSTGFILQNGATRSPDAAWILKKRIDEISSLEKKHFPHICPDFIIELLSESDSLKVTKEKMIEWTDNGCRLAWLVDFENQTAYIYKPNREVIQQSFEQILNGEDILSGFELNLKEIL